MSAGSMRAILRRYALLDPKMRRFSKVRAECAIEVGRILENEAQDIFTSSMPSTINQSVLFEQIFKK